MFSRILCQKVYFATKGVVGIASPQVAVVCRGYRNRVLHRSADDPIGAGEAVTMSPSELGGDEHMESESTPLAGSEGLESEEPMAAVADSPEDEVDVSSPENLSEEEVAALERETDRVFRLDDSEDDSSSRMRAERVTKRNFEDEFFRLSDAMNRKTTENNGTAASLLGDQAVNEPVTFVEGEDVKTFFDKILSLDENEITTEDENKRLSIVREEQKEEAKEVKRNTWFNFMPAKERPEGFMDSYTPDQIYSSLEFDLLSRNVMDVYKYEKDDMLLTEVSLLIVF